jgi:PiT family inorganic phosphate transporter
MNYDLGAVNWRQLAFIFSGWVSFLHITLTSHLLQFQVMTLPVAGLISGLLCVMALNAPSF